VGQKPRWGSGLGKVYFCAVLRVGGIDGLGNWVLDEVFGLLMKAGGRPVAYVMVWVLVQELVVGVGGVWVVMGGCVRAGVAGKMRGGKKRMVKKKKMRGLLWCGALRGGEVGATIIKSSVGGCGRGEGKEEEEGWENVA